MATPAPPVEMAVLMKLLAMKGPPPQVTARFHNKWWHLELWNYHLLNNFPSMIFGSNPWKQNVRNWNLTSLREKIESFCYFISALRVLTSGTPITFPKGNKRLIFFFPKFVILYSTFQQLKHNLGLTITTGAEIKAVTVWWFLLVKGTRFWCKQGLLNSMPIATQVTNYATQFVYIM